MTERNDLTSLVLAALSEEWRTTREIVWAINGPRDTTIKKHNIETVLKRAARSGRIEKRRILQPTRNRAMLNSAESALAWRVAPVARCGGDGMTTADFSMDDDFYPAVCAALSDEAQTTAAIRDKTERILGRPALLWRVMAELSALEGEGFVRRDIGWIALTPNSQCPVYRWRWDDQSKGAA